MLLPVPMKPWTAIKKTLKGVAMTPAPVLVRTLQPLVPGVTLIVARPRTFHLALVYEVEWIRLDLTFNKKIRGGKEFYKHNL